MAVEVVLPKLGMTMEEGKILSWSKQEGEEVREGEPLFEIETDKVQMVVEAPGSGILRRVSAKAGATLAVGEVIALIAQPGEAIEELLPSATVSGLPVRTPAGPVVGQEGTVSLQPPSEAVVPTAAEEVKASPAAKKLARQHGVDLRRLIGSGPDGRIIEEDVKHAIENPPSAREVVPPGVAPAPIADAAREADHPAGSTIPLTGIQKKTAERMAASFQTVPHFYLTIEVLADRLSAVRDSLLEAVQCEAACRLSFTDLFVKSISLTLVKHPRVNAAWIEGVVYSNPEINVGIAMATKDGLVVPVIHKADTLSIPEIARRRTALSEKAREGNLTLESMEGGTITLTNLGSYGIDMFSPIINPPQAAILAIGRIAERAVRSGETMRFVPTVFITMAADHRVLGGFEGAAFLRDLKGLIEAIEPQTLQGVPPPPGTTA